MASFSLPPIHDNPDGSWGPSSSNLPETFKFKDIPYAPYSKSDKLGRFADWNDISGDNRQTASGTAVNPRTGTRGRRDGAQTFGSGIPSAFSFQVEDESSFSLVDNKTGAPRRGGGFTRGRGTGRGTTSYGSRAPQRNTRGGFTTNRGSGQRGARRGWRDWEKVSIVHVAFRIRYSIPPKNNRTRESSVAIDPSWQMLEEIEFHRLAKLRLEVDEPEEL
jgi:translation initiation factor 3 subunit D